MLTRTTPTTSTRDTIDRTDEPTIVDRDSHAARGGAPSTGPDRRMVLPVQGMTCASCVAHVEKALAQVPGVRKVAVNLATESAAVEGVGLDAAALTGAVSAAGYEVPAQHLRFAVQGMTCASCVSRIEQALAAVPGVLKVNVNLGTETATVDLVSGAASVRDLLAAIDAAGYQATLIADSGQGDAVAMDATAGLRRDALLAIALALPLLLGSHLTLVGVDWMMPAWMQWLLATPVQFWCARRFYVAAARAVRARTGNMDLLVSLGTLAAYGLSLYLWIDGVRTHGLGHMQHLYFEAAAVVIALVLLGKWLEARAKRQTSEAIRLLAALRPDKALVLRDGQPAEVPIDDVRLGDVVVIRGGDRVPVDGLVRAGTSSIDESMLTGESLPVDKAVGDKVTAGSINGGGRLEVETTAVGAETVLSKIIRLVEDAQAAKAPIQRHGRQGGGRLRAGRARHRAGHGDRLAARGRHLRARPHQRGQRAGDRLPVRARSRHADRDHRGDGRGRAARGADQGRRGARTRAADRGRRVRQDRHPDRSASRAWWRSASAPAPAGSQVLALAAAVNAGSNHPLADAVRAAVAQEPPPDSAAPAARDHRDLAGRGVSAKFDGEDGHTVELAFGSRRLMDDWKADLSALLADAERPGGAGTNRVLARAAHRRRNGGARLAGLRRRTQADREGGDRGIAPARHPHDDDLRRQRGSGRARRARSSDWKTTKPMSCRATRRSASRR